MHQISEIEKLSSGRYYITLYDGLQFPLYGKEMGKYGIEVNEVLSEEAYLEIMLELLPARAKKKALHLLERMDRTEQQLREKLKQGGYPQACIDLALEYVKSFHYVDDYRYACTYINYRQDRMSRYQLKVKLYGKGVPGEVIDRALEECYEGDEQEQIIRLLEKKKFDAQNSDQKEFTRVYQYLMRRGFRSNDVLHAMKSKQ